MAAAYDAYMELQNHLKEGSKFYNDLTQVPALAPPPVRLFVFLTMIFSGKILDCGKIDFIISYNFRPFVSKIV